MLLSFLPIQAQLVLNKIDFATGGDTVRMSKTFDLSIDYSTTGPNSSWDFSDLTPTSQVVKDFHTVGSSPFLQFFFGLFAPLKYQASYYLENTLLPIAQITQILPISIENVNQLTRRSNDSVTSIGYAMTVSGTALPFKSDTIEKRYDFPVQYGTSFTSRGYTFIDFNPILDAKWIQHRKRFSTVDGYGSITTPYGTFNAIRIKHEIKETDSIYYVLPIIGGLWIPLSLPKSNEYEWWTNNQKEPILKITTNALASNETVTAIEYRDSYRGLDLGIQEQVIDFTISPNPVKDQATIVSNSIVESIQVIDNLGKVCISIPTVSSTTYDLDLSSLKSGSYSVVLQKNGKSLPKQFIKL
jgi:transposase-like protein